MKKIYIFFFLILCYSCNNDKKPDNEQTTDVTDITPMIAYNIVKVYPHDTSAFTEGLIWYNNYLYEGTGNKGESRLVQVDINTGKAAKKIELDTAYFGEGIAILDNKIYQLTWQQHKVFVYDLATFKKIKEMQWPYEGWGMTTDGKELIISTGSSNLYFVNPDDFKIIRMIGVSDDYGPVGNINELEYVKGVVYGNKYLSDEILKINPENGKVTGKLDLTNILTKSGMQYSQVDVLNGIAYDSVKNSLYITGKYWPALFEIKVN